MYEKIDKIVSGLEQGSKRVHDKNVHDKNGFNFFSFAKINKLGAPESAKRQTPPKKGTVIIRCAGSSGENNRKTEFFLEKT
jgi:hypothetical protein